MKEVTKNPIKGTLRLKNPILINGNEITEVTYDSNEIDGILFATAESRRKAAAGRKDISIAPAAEFDFSLHLYLGFAAIVAVNPSYDFSDLERIKGHDVVEVMLSHCSTHGLQKWITNNIVFKRKEPAAEAKEVNLWT